MIDFKTSAFILVDMQNDFLAKGGYYDRKQRYLEQVQQGFLSDKEIKLLLSEPSLAPKYGFELRVEYLRIFVENIKRAFALASKNQMIVVFIKAIYSHGFEIKPPMFLKKPNRKDYPCKPDTWGADFIDPIANLILDNKIIQKHTFDGFFKTDLLQYLQEQKVNTILLAGVETHICVMTTALSASLNYFRTIILEDCVASARDDLAESALKIFQDGFGDVKMSTDIFPELIDKPDQAFQEKWIEESEKRYDAYKAGKIKALIYPEVIDKIKNKK